MARGFDSKSVTDQQEERERIRERIQDDKQPRRSPRRRQLELARVDVVRRMEHAPEPLRKTMQAALDALDEQLAKEPAE